MYGMSFPGRLSTVTGATQMSRLKKAVLVCHNKGGRQVARKSEKA